MADLPRRTHAFFQLFLFLVLLLQLPCNGPAQLCRDIASPCRCPCNGAGAPESMASKGNDECASMDSCRDTATYPHSACPHGHGESMACPGAFQENHVMDLACPCSNYPHSACVPESMACPASSFQENDQLGCMEMCSDIACPSCQPCPPTYPQCACDDDNGSPPESSASEGNVEQGCMQTCRDFTDPCCSQSTCHGNSMQQTLTCIGFGPIDELEPCASCPHSSYNELELEVVTFPSSSKGNQQHRHMGFRESTHPSCSQNPRHGSTTVQMPAFETSVSLRQNGEQGLAQMHEDRVNASFSVLILHGAGKHTQKHSSIDSGSSLMERQPVHWEGDGKVAEGRVDHPDNSESKASNSVPTEALGFVTFPSSSKGKEQHRHMEIRDSAYPSCSQSPRGIISSQILAFEQSSVSPQPHREQGLRQVHEDHANASFSVVNVDGAGEHTQVHLSMDSGSSLIENQPVHRECDGEAAEGHVDHHGNTESGAVDGVSAENLQQLQKASLQGEALYHQDPAVKDPAAVVESSQGIFGWVSDKTLLQVSEGDGVAENKQLQDGHRDKVERKATGVWNSELLEKSRNKSKGGYHWEGAGSSFNGDSYNNKEPSPATPHSPVFGVHEEDKGDASNQVTESQMTISAAAVGVGGGRRRKSWEPQSHGEGETQDSAGSGDKRRKSARLKAEDAKSSQVQLPDFLKHLTCAVEADPEVQTLNLQLLEITRKLQSGQALNGIPEGARFPSPEPNYDTTGIRINAQEVRARENLARERQEIIARLIKKNPAFCPPADYNRAPKFYKKLYVPVKEYPGYNLIGLVIGPRGNTQKRIERETAAKIVVRGRGLFKEGKILQKRNFKFDSGENEDLHVMVEANNEKSLEAAASMVKKLLAPVGKVIDEHKSAQLWELAVLNGTIRDSEYCLFCGEQVHRQLFCPSRENSFNSNLTCQICGDGGHLSIDCPMKGTCQGDKMDDEYLNFLEELGGGGNGPSSHAESGEVCSNTRQDPTLALSAINNLLSSSTAMEYSDSTSTENRPVHQERDSEAAEGNVDNQSNSDSGVSDDVPAENLRQYHREQQQHQLLQGTGLQMPLQMLEELMIRYYQVCPTYPHSTNGDCNEPALEFATSPSSSEGNEQHRNMEIRDSAYHRCSQSPRHGSSTQRSTFETSASLQRNREQGIVQVHEDHEYASCSAFSVDVVGKHVQMHLSMDNGSSFMENQLVHRDRYGQAAEGNAHHQSDVERVGSDGVPAENLQLLQGASLQGEALNHQEFFTGDGKDEIHPGGWCSQDYLSLEGDYPEQGNQEGWWCPYANNSHLQQNDENVSLFSHGEESAAVKDGAAVVKSNQGAFGWISDKTLLEVSEGDGVRENKQLQDGYKDKVERKATGVWNLELLEKTPDESKGDHWEGAGSSFNGDGFNNKEPSPATLHPRFSGVHEGDEGEASDQITGSQMTISTAEVSVNGDRRRQSRSDPQSEGEGETQDSADSVVKRRKSRWVAEEAKPSQIQWLDIFKHSTGGVEVEVDPEVQTLNFQLLEIIRKLQSGQVLNSIPEGTRSPSAEPIYNKMGIRIKTEEARARENLAREREEIIAQLIKKNPAFCPPADYGPPKLTKKLYIPAKEYPGYNLIGLVIGPRGDNQKRMERETGAKIVISGKGSIKEGEILQKRDFQFDSSENEDLHVLVEADDEKSLEAAASMVQKLLTPVDKVISDYKSVQLQELAALNGTIRDSEYCLFCGKHRHRQHFCPSREYTSNSNVTCQICGDGSHPPINCPLKGASRGNKMDGEDLNFLAVLGGGGNGPSFNVESGEVGSDTQQGPTLALSSNNPPWSSSSTAMDSGSSLIENRPVHQEHDGGAAEGHVDHQGNAESGVSDGVLADNLHQYHQEQLLQHGTGLQMHLQTEEELMMTRDHQSFPTCPHSTCEDHNGLAPEFITSLSSSKGNEQCIHMEIRDSANASCSQSPHQGCRTQMPTLETSTSLQPNGEQGLAQVHEDLGNAIFSVLSVDGAGEHTQMHLSMDSSSSLIENQPVHHEHDSQDAEGHVEHQISAESRDGDGVPAGSLQQYHQEQQQQQLLQGTGMCTPLQTEEELTIRDNQPCPTYPHNAYNDRNELALGVVTSPSSSEGNGQRRHMEIKDSAYPSCSQSPCHGSSTQMPSFETSVSLQPNREWGLAHMHEDCANASFSVLRVDGPGEHVQMYWSTDSASSVIENQPVHREHDGEAAEGHADNQGNAESGADDSAPAENLQQMQGSGLQGEAFSRQELYTGEGKDEIQPGGWFSKDCPPPEGDYPEQGNQEGWCPYANNSHLQQHNDENVNLVSHGEESPAVKDAATVVKSSQGVFGRISDETLLKVLEGDGVRENKQIQDGQRDKVERKATGVWDLELLEKTPDKSKRDHWEGSGSSFNGDSYSNKEPSPATSHSCVFGVHEEDKGDASSQMTASKMAISTAEVSVSGDRRRRSRSDPQSDGEGEMQADSADLVAKRRKSRWEAEEAKLSQIQLPDICKHLTGRVEVDPKGRTLNLQLLDMTRKLRLGQVLNGIPEGARSPSAEPVIYNNMGIKARETDDSNLYVGYLPTSVDEDGLMRLFLPFGTIQSVKLVKDCTTRISKRYGFVKFFEAAEAAQAIAHMSGYKMEGKALAVRVAGKFSPVGVNPPPDPDPANSFQPQQTDAVESEAFGHQVHSS